ncbi:restriction endonuclease [Streptomyces xylophagus]|uniref:restriction endonuclease n=1 Tax=Streptomyces xylophagus TaxID=285514 RepID=UPI0005BD50C6|nr:restriction endonuclease [Streptomyces xylophagus]
MKPGVKAVVGLIVAITLARLLWQWVRGTAVPWVGDHPWGTGFVCLGLVLLTATLIDRFGRGGYRYAYGDDAVLEDADPSGLTYRMRELAAMTPAAFEQACAELLARDGFVHSRRVGGAGDLGADVVAWDGQGRKLVLQCKQYTRRPVGSKEVQTFNGTARPEHGAHHPIMIGLSGFTQPAIAFAARHAIVLVGRPELKRWAHGTHLYDIIEAEALE